MLWLDGTHKQAGMVRLQREAPVGSLAEAEETQVRKVEVQCTP